MLRDFTEYFTLPPFCVSSVRCPTYLLLRSSSTFRRPRNFLSTSGILPRRLTFLLLTLLFSNFGLVSLKLGYSSDLTPSFSL